MAATGDDYGSALAPGERDPAPYEAGRGELVGRQFAEPVCPTRSDFQRDRDRVLHSTAFRRLTHKTQVFIYHEGDHFRSRLTHSLEVAQIARTVARQLRLNEDLAECLSLAHDLGHPPFGHAGERALDRLMADHGGFDHNAQSLRIVMKLEKKYAAFDGLNLTWDVLDGLAKHNGPIIESGTPIEKVMSELAGWNAFDLQAWPSAEAQVAALSDDVAYLTHDVDDGLRAGLISLAHLETLPLLQNVFTDKAKLPGTAAAERRYEIVRQMITMLIYDMVDESRRRLRRLKPKNPADIRGAQAGVIGFSDQMTAYISELRAFLFDRVYRSDKVMAVMGRAETIVEDLFNRYAAPGTKDALPPAWQDGSGARSRQQEMRTIADYLAGMTDRFAVAEHKRMFDVTPELR